MTELNSAEAAILIIMGQSNAHAHEQILPGTERIYVPLKNVHTLHCDENQAFENDHVVWSGFTTAGYNLGETQDHTASLAYFTAKTWQAAINSGKHLPDLYIVQISIGGEGLYAGVDDRLTGMWSMEKPQCLRPGVLLDVDISLFRLALHTLRLVRADLQKRFPAVCSLGIHWLGSEQDTEEGICRIPGFGDTYDRFFDEILHAAGESTPLALYRLACTRRELVTRQGLDAVNAIFERQCRRQPSAYTVCAADCPFYTSEEPFFGIFAPDNVHYLAKTQRWFSDSLLKRYGVISEE